MSSRQNISRNQARPPFYVGIDLGGSSSKIGVVDDEGSTLSYVTVPTAIEQGPECGSQRMGQGALDAILQAGVELGEVRRVGLGSPGTMDIAAGMLIGPVNLKGWNNFPLRDRVSHHCGLPVTFANDGAAATYGEFWLGAGREMHSLVMFTLGTGIGCGIIVDGTSIDGRHSHGAECGHIAIDFHDDARMCSCGQPGHLEAYASATALVKRTLEALEGGRKTSLNARLEHGAELSPIIIGEEAEAGDSLCLELVLDTARYLSVGIVTLMHTIDPDGVVLGGAMTFGGNNSPLGRRFLQCIREEVRRRAFPILAQQTTIDYARLGSDAGYLGAAGLARAEDRRSISKS
jgi:glucokinase